MEVALGTMVHVKPITSYKIIILGRSGIGKTALLRRFTENKFIQNIEATIGMEMGSREIDLRGVQRNDYHRLVSEASNNAINLPENPSGMIQEFTVKLMIYDLSGQNGMKIIAPTFFKTAAGVVLAYDMCDYNSFTHLHEVIKDVHSHCQDDVNLIVVATKFDLDDKPSATAAPVPPEIGREFAKEHNALFIECSSKLGINVEDTFKKLAERIHESSLNAPSPNTGITYAEPLYIGEADSEAEKYVRPCYMC